MTCAPLFILVIVMGWLSVIKRTRTCPSWAALSAVKKTFAIDPPGQLTSLTARLTYLAARLTSQWSDSHQLPEPGSPIGNPSQLGIRAAGGSRFTSSLHAGCGRTAS